MYVSSVLENRRCQCKLYFNGLYYIAGDVLCLNTTIDESMNIKSANITGPLVMYPPADDNYSEDACSILVLDTVPPSVVIASNFGQLYNCLLLPITQTEVSKVTYLIETVFKNTGPQTLSK